MIFAAPGTPRVEPAVLSGRYVLFHEGHECGRERWRIEATADGLVVSGEQEMVPPYPFPNRHEYRAALTHGWRLTGLEVLWTVGARVLRAIHAADGPLWRARIEYGGEVREQQGDFPEFCEVGYATPLFDTLILARRDFQAGGEHEFPMLRIGPPLMAVTPERARYRCVEVGAFVPPWGPVKAKRYIVSTPPRGEGEGYTY